MKVLPEFLKLTKGTAKTLNHIALIELGAGFDMDLTARENIFLNGSVLGYSHAQMREKFDEIVDFSSCMTLLMLQ